MLKGAPSRPTWNAVLTVEAILSTRGLRLEDSIAAFYRALLPSDARLRPTHTSLGNKAASVAVVKFWLVAFKPLRDRAAELERRLTRAEDAELSLEQRVSAQVEEIHQLKDDRVALSEQIEQLLRDLEGVRTARHFDAAQLRGRFSGFLQDRLHPQLVSAREGLEMRPPRADHALERLADAQRAIRDEQKWLSSSD